MSRYQKGKTNLNFTEARDRQWVAVASAGPYASLHLARTDNYASTRPLKFFYRPDALPAAQPTASKHWRHIRLSGNSIRQTVHTHCASVLSLVHSTPKTEWTRVLNTCISTRVFTSQSHDQSWTQSINQSINQKSFNRQNDITHFDTQWEIWWLFLSGSLPLSNLYMYLLCSDMVNKLLSL